MQPIRDKDFDQLFRNNFDDAEVTPSRDLWSSIESEIQPKKRRIIPIYWSAAAALLIVATIAISLYHPQNTHPFQTAKGVAPKVGKSGVVNHPVDESVASAVLPVEVNMENVKVLVKPLAVSAKTNVSVKPLKQQTLITGLELPQQATPIARVEEPNRDIKTKIEEMILQPKEETVLAANTVLAKNDVVATENIQAESKGIRNVGDVVNLIVNKVDKRKDKIIQFRTDDDESSLSSINIGPFKFGKRNK